MDFLLIFLFGAIASTTVPTDTIDAVDTTPATLENEIPNTEVEIDPLAELLKEETINTADTSTQPLTKTSMTPETDLQKGAVQDSEMVAVITTQHGDIVLRFFPEEAPKTVENFIGLAEKEYYNGIIFHRIIDGFMIQGGDPTGTGMGGESLWGGKFEDEFSNDVKNNIGSISMANAGAGTNGSQFFINTENNNFLDNRHSVFGEVIAGMEVINTISAVETNGSDKPLEELSMESVEIMTFAEYKSE